MQGRQTGSVVLEVLIAILIFSIGILGLIGMQTTVIGNVADAKYRADASFFADQIIGMMWASRVSATNASGVVTYSPDPGFACNPCTPMNGNAATKVWVGTSGVSGALPQPNNAVIAVSGNQASVTLSWQPPHAAAPHKYVAVTYIN
jgi:type IV pilus assembly protein PilV